MGSGLGNDTVSIQDAIDNFASDGDTVFVWNGTYYENVVVNKTITLQGMDRDNTIIDGMGSGSAIHVEAVGGANITGFLITNASTGININPSINNINISNNNISSNMQGIQLQLTDNITIKNNLIFNNNFEGIKVWQSIDNNITDNNVSFNNQGNAGAGIYLVDSHRNWLEKNNITYNKQ